MSDKYLAQCTISAIQYTGNESTLKDIGDFIKGTAIPYLENSILAISYDGEKCFELNIGDYLARIAGGVYLIIPAEIFEECFTKGR